jgi:hypothetical protein
MKYPPITSWQWQANLLAVLTTEDTSWPWIYSNYIMISCSEERDKGKNPMWLDFIPSGPYAMVDCPWVKASVIEKELIQTNTIKEYLINLIDKDYYIYGFFNETELLERAFDDTFYHDLFIYGYDKEKNIFNVADFTFKEKYSFETGDIDKVCKGFLDSSIKYFEILYAKGGLLLLKKNYLDTYEFDRCLVHNYFNSYIDPGDFFDIRSVRTQYFINTKYGIDVYDMIVEITNSLYENNLYDVKTLHNLYDHKVLMVSRIEYMLNNGYLDMPMSSLNDFIDIRNKSEILWRLTLKMRASQKRDDDKRDYIANELINIKNMEVELYKKVRNKINL